MSKCPSIEKTIQKEKSPIQIEKKKREVIINGISTLESDDDSTGHPVVAKPDSELAVKEEQKNDFVAQQENAEQNKRQALEHSVKESIAVNDSYFNSVCSWEYKTCIAKTGLPPFTTHARQTIVGPYSSLPFRSQIGCCFVEYYPIRNNLQKDTPVVSYLNSLIMLIKQQHGQGKTFNTWNELIPFAKSLQNQYICLKNNDKQKMIELIKSNGRVRVSFIKSYNNLYDVQNLKPSYNGVTFFYSQNFISASYQYEFIQYDSNMKPSPQKRSLQQRDLDRPDEVTGDGVLQQYMKLYPEFDAKIRPFISTEGTRKHLDALLLMSICNSHSPIAFKRPQNKK